MTPIYDRESLEEMKGYDRPTVRVKYDCDYIDQDGRSTPGVKETTGRISVDGNNPWVVIHVGGRQIAKRFSWGLVCEVLNDKYAAPLWFSERVAYEV